MPSLREKDSVLQLATPSAKVESMLSLISTTTTTTITTLSPYLNTMAMENDFRETNKQIGTQAAMTVLIDLSAICPSQELGHVWLL